VKNVSSGFGLCIVGLGIAAWPVLDRLMPQANAVGVGSVAPAVAAAALAQDPPAPTIVWYGIGSDPTVVSGGYGPMVDRVYRAWSDGTIEMRRVQYGKFNNGNFQPCSEGLNCVSPWVVVNNPASGLTFDADLNFDEAVDGVDLGMLLGKWGPAPRNPVPPSDCPLALINP
jgi:hypothetical protein